MKCFKYEKNHFKKTFWNIEKKPSKFKYINFRDLFRFLFQVVPIN